MSDIIPFPNPARPTDPAAVCRAAGEEISSPAASTLEPAERVAWAYRWTWRGAWRLRAGKDVASGYRLLGRAVMAGLIQLIGRTQTATYFMELAFEAGLFCDRGPDDGPRAA